MCWQTVVTVKAGACSVNVDGLCLPSKQVLVQLTLQDVRMC